MLWRFLKGVTVSLLVLVAFLNLAARIAMTQLDRYKPELALLFESAGIHGLELERMSGEWRGWRPRFHFEGVRLQLPGRQLPSVAIASLDVTVKPFRSLLQGRLLLSDFRARIDQLELRRGDDRRWRFNDRILVSDGPAEVPDLEALLKQLPDRLTLRVERVLLREAGQDEALVIRDLRLHSQRWRGGRRLQLEALLPEELGGRLSLRLSGDREEQRAYLETGMLDVTRLTRLIPLPATWLHSARARVRGWAEFEAFRLVQVRSLSEIEDLRLRRPGDAARVSAALNLRVEQQLMRDGEGWRSDLRLQGLRQGARHLPPVASQQYWNPAASGLQVWIQELDPAAASHWLQPLLDPAAARWLAESRVQGRLRNLLLDYRPRQPDDSRWALDLQQARFERVGRLPGLRNLSLRLVGRGRDAAAGIASRDLWLGFGDLFRDPLHASKLDAELQLSLLPDRLLLDSPRFALENADAALEGRLRLEAEPGQRPFLSLRATASRANASATPRYLPTSIMPPATVAWLDEAVRGGTARRAELLFHGRTDPLKQLTARQAGEFVAWLEIDDPQLAYRPGWPAVSRGRGTLEFHNTAMTARFADVDFGRARAQRLAVEIPDMTRARLLLSAQARNDAGDLLDSLATVEELPLFQRLRAPTESISGPVELALGLQIPLSHTEQPPLSVNADVGFDGVVWKAPDWLLDVSALRGRLVLKQRRLTGSGLKALYAGDPVDIAIDGDLETGRTDIGVEGRIRSRRLLGLMPPVFGTLFKGRSDWTLKLGLDTARDSRGVRLDIDARSDLKGTELTLPAPLHLAADETLPLHFGGRLSPKQYLDFRVDLGKRLRARGRYDSIADGDALDRVQYLNLVVGGGTLPRGDAGWRLRGVADRLDVDAWQGWFRRHGEQLDLTGEGVLARVQLLDLDVGRLDWKGRRIDGLTLALERQGGYLSGPLSSSAASGRMLWPLVSGPDSPIVLELEQLTWPEARDDAPDSDDWNPRLEDMPNLVLVSQSFRWRDMEFSDLVLRSRNDGERFEVQRLDLRKDKVLLRATGHWQHNGLAGDDITVFNISIKGPRFGEVVQKLGLGETLRGGDIDFFGQIGWGGAIDAINWDTLIGEVDLTLKDGYLRNVDPGAGRFVGLLSFSALPRRLFLDFGDVVREGLEFRKIRGKFSIKGEIMSTDNAWMDSPSAKVRIKGITNLRTKTYDQTMYIIPKVGDTLPVIGAIAGGSGLGWGILLLQKLFKKPIDKSVEIRYRVTGPWNDPRIELIKKPENPSDENPNEGFEGHPNS